MDMMWQIYLIGQLDSIHSVVGGTLAVSLCLMFFGGIATVVCWEDETVSKQVKRAIPILEGSLILLVLFLTGLKATLPTSKTAAAMVVLPQLAESQVAQKGYEGLNHLVDAWVKELEPKKEEESE